jgi:hypothetical protein
MKKIVRLTENDLARIVGRVISESYEEVDLSYENPQTGEQGIIKVAKNKFTKSSANRYLGVLLVEDGMGGYMVRAQIPAFGKTPERVKEIICNNLKRTYEILDDMLYKSPEFDITENFNIGDKYEIFDGPIVCGSNLYESKKDKYSKREILSMSKDELKDVYGDLEIKGEYLGKRGTFHHFKKTSLGDVVCSFSTDDLTPSGLKRRTQAIKVKRDDVKFD